MKLCCALLLAALLVVGYAQNSTVIDDSDCFSLECCSSTECLERNSPLRGASTECLGALAELNLESGTGQACGTCIQSAVKIDNTTETVTQENIVDFIDKEALKSCCGLQCPKLFDSYQEVVNGVCANATLSGPPVEALKLVMDMVDDECDIVEDWPFDPICAPRREESAPEGGMRVCMAHNDPHIKLFNTAMGMETCNSTGNVTLLANDHLQITALAEPVPLVEGSTVGGASLITSVTIAYKSSNCSLFDNTTSLSIDGPTLDARGSTSYTFRDPRIWTTVVLDKFTMLNGTEASKDFFSVRIITPYHEGSGVCVEGCTAEQKVDLSTLLSGRRKLLSVTEAEARAACEGAGLEEEFLESCIFDIMASGDKDTFTASTSTTSQAYEAALEAAAKETAEFEKAVSGASAAAAQDLGLLALLGLAALLLV